MNGGGWTGGQYSLFRALLGTYALVHFVTLLPWGREIFSNQGVLPDAKASPLAYLFPNFLSVWDSPFAVTLILAMGAILGLFFAAGFHDRHAAIGIWYILACTFGRNPLIANPSLPFIGWMLLAHVFVPAAPYGSWTARGRSDPAGDWRMPPAIMTAAWIVMACGYSYSGYTKLISPSWIDGTALARVLDNPLARPGVAREAMLSLPAGVLAGATWGGLALELGFAPLALSRRVRPWIWCLMTLIHLGLIVTIDFAELSVGMLLLHVFTFDPGWVTRRTAAGTDRVFYDGNCGLCARAVRFALAEDARGDAFRFAPLDSATFLAATTPGERASLPDSMIVKTHDGRLLARSTAVLHMLDRCGGAWRIVAWVASRVPVFLRDAIYVVVARIRHRLFAPPDDVCPLLPERLRARFDV